CRQRRRSQPITFQALEATEALVVPTPRLSPMPGDRVARLAALEYHIVAIRADVEDLAREIFCHKNTLPGASADFHALKKFRKLLGSMLKRYDPVISDSVEMFETETVELACEDR